MDLLENDVLLMEANLVLKQELQNLLNELRSHLSDLLLLFSTHTDAEKQVKAGKYLLTTANNVTLAKCMVAISRNAVSEADLALKLSKHPGVSYQSRIYPEKPWKLQQLQDSFNYLKELDHLINGTDIDCSILSQHHVLNLLGSIMYHLKCAKDSLILPKRRTLEELVKNPLNKCFNPPLPNDMVISFYVQGYKLIMAIYHLCTNQSGRVDISNRHQMECIVPWLNDSSNLIIYSLWKCQQLKDKMHILEHAKG